MNSFKQKYLINFWDNSRAMITLGILSAVYFGIFGGVWAVTGEMTRWGGEFLELLGMDLNGYSYYQKQNLNGTPLTRTDGIMLIGMFIGCLVAALLANKVKFRLPRDEKSRTFSSNSKRSYILRTSSRSRRLILSSIVSFAVWLKCTRTI